VVFVSPSFFLADRPWPQREFLTAITHFIPVFVVFIGGDPRLIDRVAQCGYQVSRETLPLSVQKELTFDQDGKIQVGGIIKGLSCIVTKSEEEMPFVMQRLYDAFWKHEKVSALMKGSCPRLRLLPRHWIDLSQQVGKVQPLTKEKSFILFQDLLDRNVRTIRTLVVSVCVCVWVCGCVGRCEKG
jgi:hypothetical protein